MKGYTLMEIFVVLILISGIVFFAIPSLQQLFLANKANLQINQLIRLLNYARNLAIIQGKSVILCPVAQTNADCGKNWGNGINIYLQLSTNHIVLIKTSSDFVDGNFSWNRKSQKIIFASNGFLKSQNGTFVYQLKNQHNYGKSIFLSSTGRVRIVAGY